MSLERAMSLATAMGSRKSVYPDRDALVRITSLAGVLAETRAQDETLVQEVLAVAKAVREDVAATQATMREIAGILREAASTLGDPTTSSRAFRISGMYDGLAGHADAELDTLDDDGGFGVRTLLDAAGTLTSVAITRDSLDGVCRYVGAMLERMVSRPSLH